MNESFNCKRKCLIYLLSCKTYGKQCTGKAVDRFKSKLNNCKTDAIKSANGNIISCKQQFLQNYILQNSHNRFLVDVEFALIDNNRDTEPTKREHYGMRTIKTLYFDGLNL